MDINLFTEMLNDKSALNLNKLKYKYKDQNIMEYIEILSKNFFQELSLNDFESKHIVMLPHKINMRSQLAKSLLKSFSDVKYGMKAMEDEVISTLSIEQIHTTRASVRNILNGLAPKNNNENKIYGLKLGLDFISDLSNKINEHNLYKLYTITIGNYLSEQDKLLEGEKYRHDSVYVMSDKVEHQGLDFKMLSSYINNLINFINKEDNIDQLIKSIIIHYYFAYLHPYFDGNGRMARLLQLWYLVQSGYTSSMFASFSSLINDTKNEYYGAFTQISENYHISKVLDVTPFINYFIDNVFSGLTKQNENTNYLDDFNKLLSLGEITEKEKDLFYFVVSTYGKNEFSTKQLEKDYRDVAYATVRSFVLKLEKQGILVSTKYKNRIKYKLI